MASATRVFCGSGEIKLREWVTPMAVLRESGDPSRSKHRGNEELVEFLVQEDISEVYDVLSAAPCAKILSRHSNGVCHHCSADKKDLAKVALRLFACCRYLRTSEPRDYVYGMLGPLSSFVKLPLDYERPVQLVYEDAPVSLMENTSSLELLIQAWSQQPDLPSWVPNFGAYPKSQMMLTYYKQGGACAEANLGLEHPAPDVLRISAILIDTFNKTSSEEDSRLVRELEWQFAPFVNWAKMYSEYLASKPTK